MQHTKESNREHVIKMCISHPTFLDILNKMSAVLSWILYFVGSPHVLNPIYSGDQTLRNINL